MQVQRWELVKPIKVYNKCLKTYICIKSKKIFFV